MFVNFKTRLHAAVWSLDLRSGGIQKSKLLGTGEPVNPFRASKLETRFLRQPSGSAAELGCRCLWAAPEQRGTAAQGSPSRWAYSEREAQLHWKHLTSYTSVCFQLHVKIDNNKKRNSGDGPDPKITSHTNEKQLEIHVPKLTLF